ncbi:nucleotidyltransferase family protein [Kitasatospora sp. NPDC093550]|uniref:nucleotidyltransferase family protein n=1 Tax=Kitasatospora sp. NPDC093550 TaxID=3364089 RepID=UPI0037F9B194
MRPWTPHRRTDARLPELLSLCSIQPRFTIEQSIQALQAFGADEAADVLGRQRCRSIVVARLEPFRVHRTVARCLDLLEPRAARIRHMHAVLDANLDRIDTLARELGLPVLAFKGLAARRGYADPAQRDFGDLDLYVHSRAEAGRLAAALRKGYGYRLNPDELPWLKYDRAAHLVYGQINLLAPNGADDLLNVDVHFGDYSVRHCARLGLDRAPGLATGPGLSVMPAEENLAGGVNNAAGDHFVTIKDTNDLLSALDRDDFDWGRFRTLVEDAGLTQFLGHIVDKLRLSSLLTPRQTEALRRLPRARGLEPRPRLDRPDWHRRYLATTVHAFRVTRAQGTVPALRTAAGAYAYYSKRLRLSLDRVDRAPDLLERFDTSTCVRLVPVDLADALAEGSSTAAHPAATVVRRAHLVDDPGLVRADTAVGSCLVVDGEPFVATVSYRLAPGLVGAARALPRQRPGD